MYVSRYICVALLLFWDARRPSSVFEDGALTISSRSHKEEGFLPMNDPNIKKWSAKGPVVHSIVFITPRCGGSIIRVCVFLQRLFTYVVVRERT